MVLREPFVILGIHGWVTGKASFCPVVPSLLCLLPLRKRFSFSIIPARQKTKHGEGLAWRIKRHGPPATRR